MSQTLVRSLGREDALEKRMATPSNIFAWRIPQTEEPGRLHSMGLQRVRHDWATKQSTAHTPYEVIINIGYIPCAIHYILITVSFVPSSLYLLIPFNYLATPTALSPLVTTSFFCICESVSVLLYLFVLFLDFTYKWNNTIFVFLISLICDLFH